MKITRRQFAVAASSFVTLTVLGCDRKEGGGESAASAGGEDKPQLPNEPFDVGSLQRFAQPGVYAEFQAKSVFVVNDGKSLFALNGACTHIGCATEWDGQEKHFVCPCHESRFDEQGQNQPGAKAKRPLERLGISLHDSAEGPVVRIDPTRRIAVQADWATPGASLSLSAAGS